MSSKKITPFRRKVLIISVLIGLGWIQSGAALMGQPKATTASTADKDYLPIEQIMSTAVKNIAARYNLNADQSAYTDALMRREVHSFLREHSDEVWPVIRGIWDIQRGGAKQLNGEAAKNLGAAAVPLFNLVQEAILNANSEWRNCLSEQQKRVHDYDLKEMQNTFKQIDQNLENLKEGNISDQGIFPPPKKLVNEPPRPVKPTSQSPEAVAEVINASLFDTVVDAFIKKYQLDPGQIEAARSILKEFKNYANKYFANKKRDFGRARRARAEAVRMGDWQAVRKVDNNLNKLLEPIHALVDQMNVRLNNLLTKEQIERFKGSDNKGKTPTPIAPAKQQSKKAQKKAQPQK